MEGPWWASPLLAILAYVALSFIVPAIAPDHPAFEALRTAGPIIAPWAALILLIPMPFAFLNGRRRHRLADTHQGRTTIRTLPRRKLEELVTEAYRRRGYQVTESPAPGPKAGIDLRLVRDGKLHLVHSKHWRSRKIGVRAVRELYQVMNREIASSGSLVTNGTFTEAARQFANGKAIELIDGVELERLLSRSSPSPDPAAGTSVPSNQACPQCGSRLVTRTARRGQRVGQQFLGCSSFPKCRYTREH